MLKLFLASKANEVLDKFAKLLPKSASEYKVAFIPTAANTYESRPFQELDRAKLLEFGFKVFDFDIEGKNESEVYDGLRNADIIFVAGGNSFYLLEKSRESGFDKFVKEAVGKGIIYVGSSAGSVIASPDITPTMPMDSHDIAKNLSDYKGLGFVNFTIVPHFGRDKYREKIAKIKSEYDDKFDLLFLTDQQAVVVDGERVEVV